VNSLDPEPSSTGLSFLEMSKINPCLTSLTGENEIKIKFTSLSKLLIY